LNATTTVILGGGFGGISAANSLRRLLPDEHDIVVIDESPRFHVGAGKTWIMLGERTYEQISQSRVALLAPGVRLVEEKVQNIGPSLPKAGVFAEAHGRIVAHQIAARILGRTPDEAFDGRGYCYLETGAKRAVRAEGSFFELPHPVMQKRTSDEAQFNDKLDWVERLLLPAR
jgi:NADH dehydrogenase FAD-containing subunit